MMHETVPTRIYKLCRGNNALIEVYKNFENALDEKYLSEILGIQVINVSEFMRNITQKVYVLNSSHEDMEYCMASFPFAGIYMVIKMADADKAHSLGLQLQYFC